MKFVGFEIPVKDWDDIEWLYNVIEDRGDTIFYLVESQNPNQARLKVFKEMYYSWDEYKRAIIANQRAEHILEDLHPELVLEKYGEHDGNLIVNISEEYLDMNEEQQKSLGPYNKNIDKLSEATIYDLALEQKLINIGIAKVKTI